MATIYRFCHNNKAEAQLNSTDESEVPWIIKFSVTCGQSYKQFTLVNYNSRVVPDLKKPHITNLGL